MRGSGRRGALGGTDGAHCSRDLSRRCVKVVWMSVNADITTCQIGGNPESRGWAQEIAPDTGVVQVASYASVNDVGRAINPTIVIGQLDGGAVQGLGQALCEQMVYERESGQLQTGTLMDYALPRVDLIQRFNTQLDQSTPCLTNPLGVKGVGELGTIGATPAVVNAVVDALQRAGAGARADQLQMPLTSERVWSALHGRTA
ncbi:MAG: xanthine dehydrogenase family protein molybdopterin-binding subunit [Planctomycetes bacterium]|nr:xanthine dehydrogenase family protein molybdopterin-binding subunit [Planctomycetota bacterium]